MKENKKHIDQWLKDTVSNAEYQPKAEDWQAFEAIYFKEKKKKGFFWILPVVVLLGSLIYIALLDKNDSKKIVTHKSSVTKKLSKNTQSLASENLNTTSTFIKQENYISSKNTIKNIKIFKENHTNKLYNSLKGFDNEDKYTSKSSNNINKETYIESNITNSDDVDSVESISNKNSIPSEENTIYNKPKNINKSKKQVWFIGFDTYYLLASKQASTNNNIDIQLSKNINYMVEGYIGINVKKNISIQTGLGYYKSCFNTTTNEETLNINTSFSQVTNINMDTASKKLVKVTHHIAQYDTVYSQSKKQATVSTNYIYLPVNLKYQLPIFNRLNFITTIGFNYYIQTSSIIIGEGLNQIPLLPKTNKSVNFGLDMGYKIGNKIQLSAGIHIYTFAKNSNIYLITNQQNLNSHLGVKYSF